MATTGSALESHAERLIAECGTISDDDAGGWHGYLTLEPDGSALAAPFCPDCSEAQFGES